VDFQTDRLIQVHAPTLRYVMLFYVMLFYVMLFYVTLRYVTLCYIMLIPVSPLTCFHLLFSPLFLPILTSCFNLCSQLYPPDRTRFAPLSLAAPSSPSR
jgi:hypothetical protein